MILMPLSKSSVYLSNKWNIANKLAKYYSKLNNLNLIGLNLICKYSKYNFWFICNKTNKIYYFYIYSDQTKSLNNSNIQKILNKLNQKKSKINKIDNSKKLLTTYETNSFANCTKIYFELITSKTNNINDYILLLKDNSKFCFLKNIITQNIKNNNIINKKRKINNSWSDIDMVAASHIRNYVLNDPLLDYLKEYNINSLNDKPTKHNYSKCNIDVPVDLFSKFIMDEGIDHEKKIYKILSDNHKIITACDYTECKTKQAFNKTIQLMKEGYPIIYQGVLHNYENNTFGMPDLLVRSDYINKLLGYNVITEEEANIKSPKLKINFHYKVIDIKHSIIPLRSDGEYILNTDSMQVYKCQLYIYTEALNKVLGININKAFIWGKRYNYECKNIKYEISNFLNKLGVINYDTIDLNFTKITNNAIEWIRTVRNEGYTWTLLPLPCRNELYPNMKNEKDSQWKKLKLNLNEKIYEITSIWNCGVTRRNMAHDNNVFSWNNPRCTAKLMGFNDGKIALTIDKILNINRQNKYLIRPEKILYDRNNWVRCNKNIMEFYLDFETLNSNFGSINKDNEYNNNQFIFLIGIGYFKNNKWIFKYFLMNDKSISSEINNFNNFFTYINKILKNNNKKLAKFYHWSDAEVNAYNNFKKRHSNCNFKDKAYSFYDLNKVFINEPVVIKDSLNFSIKSVAKALYKHNLIKSSWNNNSVCANGLSAMILANKIYDNNNINNINNETIMKDIIYYNEIDCKVLCEIHQLIKKKL
jgi:hypothetical protein